MCEIVEVGNSSAIPMSFVVVNMLLSMKFSTFIAMTGRSGASVLITRVYLYMHIDTLYLTSLCVGVVLFRAYHYLLITKGIVSCGC